MTWLIRFDGHVITNPSVAKAIRLLSELVVSCFRADAGAGADAKI